MAITAIELSSNQVVNAEELQCQKGPFVCRECKQPMCFVNARVRVKHFRHLVDSNCSSEPESEAHDFLKNLVWRRLQMFVERDKLRPTNNDSVELECPVGSMRADVLWRTVWGGGGKEVIGELSRRDIAFEIQVSSVDYSVYEEKIAGYARQNVFVVYLFVPGNFRARHPSGDVLLKQIERKFFVSVPDELRTWDNLATAAYIEGTRIVQPEFVRRRGCATRFVEKPRPKYWEMADFLRFVWWKAFDLVHDLRQACEHRMTRYEFSDLKIKRYKVVCVRCGLSLGWLPNAKARELGLPF